MARMTAIGKLTNVAILAKGGTNAHNLRSENLEKRAHFATGLGAPIPLLIRRILETQLSASCATLHQRGATVDGHLAEADVRAPMERLLGALVAMTSARAATLRSRTGAGAGAEMELVAAAGIKAEEFDRIANIHVGCGVCCEAVRESAVQIAKQTCQCVRELSDQGDDGHLVAAIPLRSRGEASGVLSLFFEIGTEKSALPKTVMDMLPALGEVLGLALENALLSEADFHAGLMLQRQLIANEVHDSLAQNLASVRMRTALLRDAVAKHDAMRTADYLSEIDESLAVAQSRVREIITDFRSQMGATQLVPALESAIDELRTASGVQIDFDSGDHEPRLSAFEQVQVFYIAREALTNALKHAKATCVRVALAEVDEQIELRVEDNGVGLDRSRSTDAGHFGLDIMSERAGRIGGVIEFEMGVDGGTRVRLRFPSRMVHGEAEA